APGRALRRPQPVLRRRPGGSAPRRGRQRGGRPAPRRCRGARVRRLGRSSAVAFVLAAALAWAGCGGGVQAADLFLVTREGPAAGQKLVLLVNEEGGVTCNGRSAGKLDDAQIVE